MADIFSYVRDLSDETIDKSLMGERAKATQAHFLIEAVKLYPEITLGHDYNRVLSKDPQGIYSLPQEALYDGSTS